MSDTTKKTEYSGMVPEVMREIIHRVLSVSELEKLIQLLTWDLRVRREEEKRHGEEQG